MNSIQLTETDIISYEYVGWFTFTKKAILYHNNRQIAELKLMPEALLTRKIGGRDFVFKAKLSWTDKIKAEISYDGVLLFKT